MRPTADCRYLNTIGSFHADGIKESYLVASDVALTVNNSRNVSQEYRARALRLAIFSRLCIHAAGYLVAKATQGRNVPQRLSLSPGTANVIIPVAEDAGYYLNFANLNPINRHEGSIV